MCQFAWNWTHFNPESLVTQGTLSPREAGIACHFGTKWGPKVDPATSKMHVHWSPWILLKSLLSLICPQRKRKGLHYDHESIKRTYTSTEKTLGNNSRGCPNGLPRRLDVLCSQVHSYQLMSHSRNAGCVEIHGQGPWVGRCSPDTLSILN